MPRTPRPTLASPDRPRRPPAPWLCPFAPHSAAETGPLAQTELGGRTGEKPFFFEVRGEPDPAGQKTMNFEVPQEPTRPTKRDDQPCLLHLPAVSVVVPPPALTRPPTHQQPCPALPVSQALRALPAVGRLPAVPAARRLPPAAGKPRRPFASCCSLPAGLSTCRRQPRPPPSLPTRPDSAQTPRAGMDYPPTRWP